MQIPVRPPEISRSAIDVVAFDWDGTVVDSVPYKLRHNQAIAAEFGNELSADQVRAIWNSADGFPNLMKQLAGSNDVATIMQVVERDYDNPDYAKREFNYTRATLRTVRALGFYTALLTSASKKVLELDQSLVGLKLADHFDYVQALDDSKFKKPDGRFFAAMLKQRKTNPGRAVYVGDELKDGQAARSAGVNFIGVESGMANNLEFADNGFSSVRNIASIIFKP